MKDAAYYICVGIFVVACILLAPRIEAVFKLILALALLTIGTVVYLIVAVFEAVAWRFTKWVTKPKKENQ
jgi:multisubunit Na+/H+ antiporter MnhC subunit